MTLHTPFATHVLALSLTLSAEAGAQCPLPKSTLDVVRCAQEEHPLVKRAKLEGELSRGLAQIARQAPNPEFEIETTSGQVEDVTRSESKIALIVPIELGGKRAAREQVATAQQKRQLAEVRQIQADVIIETVLKLHRLRQLLREKGTLEEAIVTFSEVIAQQRSRPGLAPEQRVSLSVFKMALAEAKIRQSALHDEEKSHERYFRLATGHSLTDLNHVLPTAPIVWPEVHSDSSRRNSEISPAALLAHATREASAASLQAAQAESWPDLRLGPVATHEREGAKRAYIFGLQLNLPLPLFHVNGAGRTYAAQNLQKSEKIIALLETEESAVRNEQARIYQQSVQALKESPNLETLERDHNETESYARRGLVSASLLVEAHRQLEEIVKGRHDRELRALEALWQIHKLEGRILMEPL